MSARQTQVIDELVQERVDEAMRELREQMAELERVTNAAIASLPPAKRAQHEPEPAPAPKGARRWLDAVRFANKCAGGCGDRVQKGERGWYVPGTGVYHESCAPADANTAAAA